VLIALGLTTVVIIGVPALMYAINTLGNVTDYELAESFAERLHNETELVDLGVTNNTEITVTVPDYVFVVIEGNTLTVTFHKEGVAQTEWSDTYLHPISLETVITPGSRIMTIRLIDGVIEIAFFAAPV